MKAIKDMTFEDKLEQSVRFTEELGSDGSDLLIGGFLLMERMAKMVAQIEKLFPDEFKAAFEELKAEKLQ